MSKGVLESFESPETILMSDNKFVKSFLGTETYIKILSRFQVREHMDQICKEELPYKVDGDVNLRDALARMIEHGTEAMNVMENGKIEGTVWLKDIAGVFQKGQKN